jgi:Ca2+-binding RTX toxin-like protein
VKINITYDSSIADAPSGYETAIKTAVKYFEQTISTAITVNITFGWGEVAGQPFTPTDLAANVTTDVYPVSASPIIPLSYTNSPAIADALQELRGGAPEGVHEVGELPFALARTLGLASADNTVQDGYVGLGEGASYTFDPNNRAVAGKYDAIGLLESQISEVLGREAFDGAQSPGNPIGTFFQQYAPLDYFRYSAPGQHTWTPGPSYFSLNGDQLLLPFNDPSDGGDPAGWAPSVTGDAFDAFADPGTELSVSSVDVRVMELLGYTISFTAPTPNGTPVAPESLTSDLKVASGQTLTFDGPRAIILGTAGSVENSGTITDSGVRSMIDVIGIASGDSTIPVFTNEQGGVLSVTATAQAADAVGADGYARIVNSGLIQVTSQQADAWGELGTSFTNTSTGTLIVQAADHATGINYSWFDGGLFLNAGLIQVTGLHAIGASGMTSFNNSGTIEAIGQGDGATSTAVYVTAPYGSAYMNSGTIEGQYAFQVDPRFLGAFANLTITNTGTIDGVIALSESNSSIINSGSITGAIQFGNGNSTYNGTGGTELGGIFLGHGDNIVTLGNDGEAVVGGGGVDKITGGTGNDFVEIALGHNVINGGTGFNTLSFADAPLAITVNLATGAAVAGGTDRVSNIQEVIGSNYGSTLIAGSSAVTFIAGAGQDTLTGGAGNDTLIAGAGGDTMTGGGGNNSLIYSAGDQQLMVTDFGANGDQDVLTIYGYTAATSITQSGSDTLITLSADDSILLKNVTPGELAGGDVVFSANPYQAPATPIAPPVFGTQTIHFIAGLTIAQGETIDEAGQNLGLSDDPDLNEHLSRLDNSGHILVSASSGDVLGLGSELSGGLGSNIANKAGAIFSVTDTDPNGTATGINFDIAAFQNAGSFSVAAQGDAIGLEFADDPPFTNFATGTISVSSATGDATGIYAYNGDDGRGKIVNYGSLHVTGDLDAYGIFTYQDGGPVEGVTLVNKGSIVVDGVDAGTQTYGLYIAPGAIITNAGTITAATAIDGFGFAVEQATYVVTNSGTINGDIDLDAANTQIRNTGAINGAIHLGDGDSVYSGATATLTGPLTLGYGRNTVVLGQDGEAVIGGGYIDHITGGAGNDFFEIGRGVNTINGGGGSNTLSFADADQGVIADLQAGTATVSGTDKFSSIQTVIGSTFDDTLYAADSGSTLIAGSGFDTLKGRVGNDTLVAGAGGDDMFGGGGNNTFIYSSGDHKDVIADFGANGDKDVLEIDGYASASSIKQAGANTVITLAGGDSVTLKNFQASALNAGNLVFDAHPYAGPSVPASPPVFFSSHAAIRVDYGLVDGVVIYKGETLQVVSHISDVNLNQNIAILDQRFSLQRDTVPLLDNSGTINFTSADDNFFGVLSQIGFGTTLVTNRAHATISITDTTGSVTGITVGYSGVNEDGLVRNYSTINVSGQTSAIGVNQGVLTNYVHGVLTVTSATATAIGVDFSDSVENDGVITVHAATTAAGVSNLQVGGGTGFNQGTYVNNGTITALSSDPNGETFGIVVSNTANDVQYGHITNTGTITAKTAIMVADTGYGYTLVSIANSGTLNGDVNLGGGYSQLSNTGAIDGDITFLAMTQPLSNPSLFGIVPPALTNSGHIVGDFFLNGSDATITNTGTIVSNDIELGGTFISTGGSVVVGHGVTATTGAIAVGTGGTFEGTAAVQANLSVTTAGTVEAFGGTLSITGNVSGAGQISIGGAATLEVSGSLSAGVQFLDGTGTLKLHAPAGDTGQIGGLQGGDIIDLVAITAKTATVAGGILTVTDTTNDTFTFHIAGSLTGNNFTIQGDGANGSDLVFGSGSSESHTGSVDPISTETTDPVTHSHAANVVQLIEDVWARGFLYHSEHLT